MLSKYKKCGCLRDGFFDDLTAERDGKESSSDPSPFPDAANATAGDDHSLLNKDRGKGTDALRAPKKDLFRIGNKKVSFCACFFFVVKSGGQLKSTASSSTSGPVDEFPSSSSFRKDPLVENLSLAKRSVGEGTKFNTEIMV